MAKKLRRRPWSTAHVRVLKAAARKKTRASSIARTLKRTEGATRQKAFSLGLSLDALSTSTLRTKYSNSHSDTVVLSFLPRG
jgi:hypothetical protein